MASGKLSISEDKTRIETFRVQAILCQSDKRHLFRRNCILGTL